MSDIINILPDSVANQIAAGEVVDRPAGAVKELLENAMDAGATRIDLIVKDAGRTLIQVTDNGSGMSDSDARLCFERHATSKIHRSDDLFCIHTMGFRGEALASIAAIAQVELRTRLHENDMGTTVVIEGSEIKSQLPVVSPAGTSIMVRNLFFNVPARRNFLKKDSVELSHIEEVFKRIALIHHDIAFSFQSNGKLLYDLKGGSMMQRIAGIYGDHYKQRFYAVDESTDLVTIKGFVSKPEYCRRTRGEQYLFVNGRFIKHLALNGAIEHAFDDLVAERSYPSYFVSLQVDPSRIDVNIHPTKTEVKFADEHALFSILRSAVKRSLGQFTLANKIDFETPQEFNIAPAPAGYHPMPPRISYNADYNPFRSQPLQTSMEHSLFDQERKQMETTESQLIESTMAEMPPTDAGQPCMMVQGRYIVTALSSGIAIIEWRRAQERIIYERLMHGGENASLSQTLLFPTTCRFTPADSEMLAELLPDLKKYGFDITAIGQQTFVVSATPVGFKEAELQQFLEQMLAEYKNATLQRFANRDHNLCASIARQSASAVTAIPRQEEMQQTVADLFACTMPDTTPSGKKIIEIVKPENCFN
ncbi:MAG: DNA mismatch repair endonuclease MutL [Bacteroidales bacterium]|nr:DNA mismatch repair endonuclease MutL [Bacteroidales bacterium]